MRVAASAIGAAQPSLQEKNALNYAKKGIILALLSGMIFSLDSLLVEKSKEAHPFNRPELLLLVPFICALAHDFSAALLTTLANLRAGRIKDLGRSLLSKPGRYVIAGALIGSTCGMGGYMAAIQLAGPAYVLPVTSLYPAVAAVLAVFTIKERITPRAWAGLAFCVAGVITVGYTAPQGETSGIFYAGMAFAALAALGWGAEGVCATSGMDFIEPVIALNIYYIVSTTIYLCILVPVMSLVVLPAAGGITVLAEFALSPGLLFVALAGCVGSFSYQCWYKAMNMTGVSRAMALNITYALWGIIFAAIFTRAEITLNLIIGALVILGGMFLIIGNPRDMLNLRKSG